MSEVQSLAPVSGRLRRALLLGWAIAPVAMLAACGGGSSGGVNSTPGTGGTASPTPTPTATPTAQFDTAEYRQSDGPSQHNAISAWSKGWSGEDVTIAIVDSGIDVDNSEFAGRLSSASKDIYSSRNQLDATDDHGTLVALVAAAARDNSGILGMAWSADVLAIRADTPGSCTTDDPASADDCFFSESAIAASIDYAVASGAQVINISLGGDGSITTQLRNAVADAVAAGVLVVVAAGNAGGSELEGFPASLVDAGSGGVIVVGSVDENDAISDFSNRAGTYAGSYITARGETLCCIYEDSDIYVDADGYAYLFSGTSFATPQVAGAAALLAQAFPNLTGTEIAEILFDSARDAGASGVDVVYGNGILDLEAAFQPIGPTSLAGSTTAIVLGSDTGSGSPAMGDAVGGALLTSIVTDRYDRAFQVNLGAGLRSAPVRTRLAGAVETRSRNLSLGSDTAAIAFSIDARGAGMPQVGALELSESDAARARVLAARAALEIAPGTALGFAYGQSGEMLVAQLQGQSHPAFAIAPAASSAQGLFMQPDAALALRHEIGDIGVTIAADSGAVLGAEANTAAAWRDYREDERMRATSIAFDRAWGAFSTAVGVTFMQEDATLLGGRFNRAFGMGGADSLFLDVSAGINFAPGWRLGGSLVEGRTNARSGGLVATGSRLHSRAWSLDLERRGVFAADDALAFRLAQPLRVESGGLRLNLPVDYDYETLTATNAVQTLSLAPTGRELIGELRWSGSLLGGNAGASLFYRRDPGHYEDLPDDRGLTLRYSRKF